MKSFLTILSMLVVGILGIELLPLNLGIGLWIGLIIWTAYKFIA